MTCKNLPKANSTVASPPLGLPEVLETTDYFIAVIGRKAEPIATRVLILLLRRGHITGVAQGPVWRLIGSTALGLLLLFNLVFTPNFFQLEWREGHLYGTLMDILKEEELETIAF